MADGDTIHAVIRGFATNNDGGFKMSFTAPSLDGQLEVIATAQAVAGVPAESITYVETHGTGTPLGDPVEVAALTEVFAAATAAARVLRPGLDQDQHRPSRRGGGGRGPDQGHPGGGARGPAAQPPFRDSQPAHRLRAQPLLRQHRMPALAAGGLAAARRRQRLRASAASTRT